MKTKIKLLIFILLISSGSLFAKKDWVQKHKIVNENFTHLECVDSLNCFAFGHYLDTVRIYKSIDQGDTWQLTYESDQSEDVVYTLGRFQALDKGSSISITYLGSPGYGPISFYSDSIPKEKLDPFKSQYEITNAEFESLSSLIKSFIDKDEECEKSFDWCLDIKIIQNDNIIYFNLNKEEDYYSFFKSIFDHMKNNFRQTKYDEIFYFLKGVLPEKENDSENK